MDNIGCACPTSSYDFDNSSNDNNNLIDRQKIKEKLKKMCNCVKNKQ